MGLDHPVGDGEAESVAHSLLCRFAAKEGFENKCKVRGPHAGSFVGNRNPDLAVQRIVFAKDTNLSAARCVPRGVTHHVFERTMQQLAVASYSSATTSLTSSATFTLSSSLFGIPEL
jgi:hypothetical protein